MPCHGSVYCDVCLLPILEGMDGRREDIPEITDEVCEKVKWINDDTCAVIHSDGTICEGLDQGNGDLMHRVYCPTHNKYHGMYWEDCVLLHKTCYDLTLKMNTSPETTYQNIKKYHQKIRTRYPLTDYEITYNVDHFGHMYLLCWELFGEDKYIDSQACHFDQFRDNLNIFFDPKMPENIHQKARFDKIFKDIFR
jgi:hypothetical protein